MDIKSKASQQVKIEGNCRCAKCRTLKVKKWLVNKRASLFSMCEQFRKAFAVGDRTTLEELPTYLGFGQCICCGYTLLHLAVSVASKQLVSCYLARYIDLETRTEHGETALHLACTLEDPWFAEQLLIHNANVNAVDNLGCNPLQICLTRDKPSTAFLKILLSHNAKPNKLFKPDEDEEKSIDKMIKANARNSSGMLPLYEAVHKRDHVRTRNLLQDGACPNSLKCYRRTLLQVACFNRSVNCVKALLGAGVDVNESDLEGRTALHYAVISNNKELVTLLSLHKCDIWARDSDGYTALGMAALTDRVAVTKALLKQGARCTEVLLMEALERRCTKVVLLILGECYFRVHDTKFGQTLLCCAVVTEQQEVVEYLMSLGVEVPYEESEDEEPRKIVLKKVEVPNSVMTARSTGISSQKRPYIPRLHSRAPSDLQCTPTSSSEFVAVESKSKIQTRQGDKFSQLHETRTLKKRTTSPPAAKESSSTRLKCTKVSSSKKDATLAPEVQSFFKALDKIPDAEPRKTKHAGSFVRFKCQKESDSKLTTYKGVFFKTSREKDGNKENSSSVDTFFKFYELCIA